jgi:hypothetical protein
MPLSSPFHRTLLATVLSLLAAATIVTYPPATGSAVPADGRKSGEHDIAAMDGSGDSSTPRVN